MSDRGGDAALLRAAQRYLGAAVRGQRRGLELVRDTLAEAGVPACVTLAGGYAEDIRDTVEVNLGTVTAFSASRS